MKTNTDATNVEEMSASSVPLQNHIDQLVDLVKAVADGREFSWSAMRLIHFVKYNSGALESELLS